MLSRTEKTVYRGCVELEENLIVRLQSERKAQRFIYLFKPESQIELTSVRKTKHLILDGEDLGIITKQHFGRINDYCKQLLNSSNHSYLPSSTPIQLSSNIEISIDGKTCDYEILPPTSEWISSSRTERRIGDTVEEIAYELVTIQKGETANSDFIQRLESIDRELKRREQSSCEIERGFAAVHREQLEIALEQREIAIGQEEIRRQQQEIARQRSLMAENRRKDSIARRAKFDRDEVFYGAISKASGCERERLMVEYYLATRTDYTD